MKLITQKSREYKGKEYYKHQINIPTKVVEELGWDKDQELEYEVDGDELEIEPADD